MGCRLWGCTELDTTEETEQQQQPHIKPSPLFASCLSATLKDTFFADSYSDFGYFRPENDSKCVEQPELKGHDLEFCLYGREEHLTTNG